MRYVFYINPMAGKGKLQDDIINNIKVIKWGLDEDFVLGEKN